jgi:hypothetical protein
MSVPKAAARKAKQPARGSRAPRATAKPAAKSVAAKSVAAKPTGASDEASAAAKKLATEVERALAEGRTDVLSADAIQALMAVACRSYAAQVEAGMSFAPLGERSRVTSTDVMVTASGLLRSANLAVFELGMWQSWTGR